ncbi:MAG: hypothetical protein Q9179_006610, partial [Wetmoreana sp. 5 TL-2023]
MCNQRKGRRSRMDAVEKFSVRAWVKTMKRGDCIDKKVQIAIKELMLVALDSKFTDKGSARGMLVQEGRVQMLQLFLLVQRQIDLHAVEQVGKRGDSPGAADTCDRIEVGEGAI